MSIRSQVLDAFARLEKRTGQTVFRLRDVVAEVLNSNSRLTAQTVRTYVTSVMCSNAPVHHANHTDDLFRVERGMYKRLDANQIPPEQPPDKNSVGHVTASSESELLDPNWHWEGQVQASIVTGLAANGWRVMSVANTESRTAGTDIVADKDGRRLHVEVKGYPSDTYALGERRGQPKPTHPATQARVWFAGAVMKAAMLRNDHPEDQIAIGLPSFGTYRTLAERVSVTLDGARLGLIWVDDSGHVEFQLKSGEEI